MVTKFERFFSPAGENRGIHLYLPDDYYESLERYPVIYMFDGHNLYILTVRQPLARALA